MIRCGTENIRLCSLETKHDVPPAINLQLFQSKFSIQSVYSRKFIGKLNIIPKFTVAKTLISRRDIRSCFQRDVPNTHWLVLFSKGWKTSERGAGNCEIQHFSDEMLRGSINYRDVLTSRLGRKGREVEEKVTSSRVNKEEALERQRHSRVSIEPAWWNGRKGDWKEFRALANATRRKKCWRSRKRAVDNVALLCQGACHVILPNLLLFSTTVDQPPTLTRVNRLFTLHPRSFPPLLDTACFKKYEEWKVEIFLSGSDWIFYSQIFWYQNWLFQIFLYRIIWQTINNSWRLDFGPLCTSVSLSLETPLATSSIFFPRSCTEHDQPHRCTPPPTTQPQPLSSSSFSSSSCTSPSPTAYVNKVNLRKR